MMWTLKALWPVLAVAAALYLAGLDWGLPSAARARIVLTPGQASDRFYRALEDNRRAMYERIGVNVQAAYGRGTWNGELLPSATGFQLIRNPAGAPPASVLMHGYSSFLLRSVDQDEQFSLNAISHFKPRRLDFNPRQTSTGGAYLYPLAGFFAALHVAGYLHLVPDPLYYYRNPDELARLYIAGRLLSVFCGLGCLVTVFMIGRLLYDERAGRWSAAIFGLTPFMIAWTHLLKLHTAGAFLALWCLYLCLKGAREGSPREFLKANLLFGLAVGAAKFYWILALPMWVCYHMAHPRRPGARQWLTMVGWNLIAVGVFCVTNPYALADFGEFLDEMRAESGWYSSSLNPAAMLRLAGLPLRAGLGPAAWLLGLGALAGLLYRRGAAEKLLLVAIVPIFAAISFLVSSAAGAPATIRFCLCPAALLVIMAAGWLLTQSPWRGARWPGLLLGLVVGFNAIQASLYDANFLADGARRSNNFEAGRWIEKNIPKGASMGFGTPAPMLDRFPLLRFSDYELVYFNGPTQGVDAKSLPQYYATRARSEADLPPSVAARYEIMKVFNNRPWLEDPFTSVNFPVALLKRNQDAE